MQSIANSPQPPSPAALRMRRARERRRQGGSIVSLEVGSGAIADLIALGWLVEVDSGNKDAITRALIDLYDRAMQTRVARPAGSQGQVCFMCDLQRSTIETLVSLGWLYADRQDDLAAIVRAFRGFASRA